MSNYDVTFFVQMRANSSRLPFKYRLPFFERLSLSQYLMTRLGVIAQRFQGCVLLSTGTSSFDDDLVLHLEGFFDHLQQVSDVSNICERISLGAKYGSRLVRVWGDCPFICGGVVEQILNSVDAGNSFVSSSGDSNMFAKGLDLEAYSADGIKKIQDVTSKCEGEILEFPMLAFEKYYKTDIVRLKSLHNTAAFNLTVDYEEDRKRLALVAKLLGEPESLFSTEEKLKRLSVEGEVDLVGSKKLSRNTEFKVLKRRMYDNY